MMFFLTGEIDVGARKSLMEEENLLEENENNLGFDFGRKSQCFSFNLTI